MVHWKGNCKRFDQGYSVAEFAVTLPILVLLTYLIVWCASVVQTHLNLLGLAQTTVRIIARGDVIPESLKEDLAAKATMKVTQHGEILKVELSTYRSAPFGWVSRGIEIRESATAIVELTENDFEQD